MRVAQAILEIFSSFRYSVVYRVAALLHYSCIGFFPLQLFGYGVVQIINKYNKY